MFKKVFFVRQFLGFWAGSHRILFLNNNVISEQTSAGGVGSEASFERLLLFPSLLADFCGLGVVSKPVSDFSSNCTSKKKGKN